MPFMSQENDLLSHKSAKYEYETPHQAKTNSIQLQHYSITLLYLDWKYNFRAVFAVFSTEFYLDVFMKPSKWFDQRVPSKIQHFLHSVFAVEIGGNEIALFIPVGDPQDACSISRQT